MAMIINSNIASLNAQRNLTSSQADLGVSLQRLSTGLRINSAKDDAAGLAISERFTTQIRGLNQAARNANDGISLAQTAEGALGGVTDLLQRVRELSVQSANATNNVSDRAALQSEVTQLVEEINRVAQTTSFNGVQLLDGSFLAQAFQVGANAGQTVSIASVANAQTNVLGLSYEGGVTGTAVTGALGAADLTINGNAVAATAGDAALIAGAIMTADSSVTATATNVQTITFGTVTGTSATPSTVSPGTFTTAQSDGAAATNGTFTGTNAVGSTDYSGGNGLTFNVTVDGGAAQAITLNSNYLTQTELLDATNGGEGYDGINAQLTGATASIVGGNLVITSDTTGTSSTIAISDVVASGTAVDIATGTASNGDAAIAPTDTAFTMTIDGITLTSVSAGVGVEVTGENLDTALATFLSGNTGYSSSGSFATNDLVLTKADGTVATIAITSNFSQQAGAFTGDLVSTDGQPAGAVSYTLSLDGTALDLTAASADNSITAAEIAGLVNGLTGYTATEASGVITVTKADGSNIVAVEGGTGAAGDFAGTYRGTIALTSNADIVIAGDAPANAGLTADTYAAGAAQAGTAVGDIDITTAANAQTAIGIVDRALTEINSSRADLGALQNRFEAVVSNISITSENLSAARSRIMDADFAAETAALTRAQILQQAGVSILAQANSLPQLALSLLQ